MTRTLLIATLVVLTPLVAAQDTEIPEEKKVAIRELLDSTGTLDYGQQLADVFIQQLTLSLDQAQDDAPPRAYDILGEEVMAVIGEELDKGSFEELLYPIYHRYYSLEEIQQLLEFYSTPVGRKTIQVLPALTQDSVEAGQVWGAILTPVINARIEQRFTDEGIGLN